MKNNVTIQHISKDNYEKVLKLKASEDLVAPNWLSLADAYVSLKNAVDENKLHLAYMPFAILHDNDVVGFAMVNYDDSDYFESGAGYFWLSRLMIDEKYQRKGYGTTAMKLLIDFIKTKPNGCEAKYFYTSYGSNNPNISIEGTAKTYAGLGFEKTGQMLDDEEVIRLVL